MLRDGPWIVLMLVAFAIGSSIVAIVSVFDPRSIGSHAAIYTDAAAAWLAGGNPWTVGPPAAVFAGPPPMLVPFVPFIGLPLTVTRVIWVVGSAILAIVVMRRLGLPGYWLGFPPIFEAILIGHPEVLVLWLLVLGGQASGLAALIKPYAVFALIAERRWLAMAIGGVVLLVTAPFLPWQQFIDELPRIAVATRVQNHGDTTFGSPVLMVIAVIALATLGLRRALWLAVPVLWPFAQPTYKVVTMPQLSPLLATFWALPIPGATLLGLVAEAILVTLSRRRTLPAWVVAGVGPASAWPERTASPAGAPA